MISVTVDAQGQMLGNPIDVLLASYARGLLSAPLHALVASHLAIKPDSRRFVSALESAGGRLLETVTPGAVGNRDRRLAEIFAAGDAPAPVQPVGADAIVPAPLARYLGRPLADVPWRTLLPGVKEFKIEDNADGEASLYWIRAGRKIPSHTHDGSEFTLVLSGAFSDINGHYERGDIAVGDSDVDHRPTADPDADCFCFAVTDAPLRLTGPIGRIVQRLFGH